MERLSADQIQDAVRRALAEDIGSGDITTLAIVPEDASASARMIAREPLTVAGLAFAEAAFRELSSEIQIERQTQDAQQVPAGGRLLSLSGPARPLLTGERVALNFVQHCSGIATLTRHYVEAVKGTQAKILDTRKTMPGWRAFEKYSVACGGGQNHRFGLFDLVLIKDNHLATLRGAKPNPIAAAIQRARTNCPDVKIEVETDNLRQVAQAVEGGADIILLDNMSPPELQAAVALVHGRAKTEASGGVTLSSVRAIAEAGVDFISIGALTHSAPAVDIGLDFLP